MSSPAVMLRPAERMYSNVSERRNSTLGTAKGIPAESLRARSAARVHPLAHDCPSTRSSLLGKHPQESSNLGGVMMSSYLGPKTSTSQHGFATVALFTASDGKIKKLSRKSGMRRENPNIFIHAAAESTAQQHGIKTATKDEGNTFVCCQYF